MTPTESTPPKVALLEGTCPRCEGRKAIDSMGLLSCDICSGLGFVKFTRTWTHADDGILERLVDEGRPYPFIAAELARPTGVVIARARELNLHSPWDEPTRPALTIRDVDGAAISPQDPARGGGW